MNRNQDTWHASKSWVARGLVVILLVMGAEATIKADQLKVSVGQTRIIMRKANYPSLFKSADGSIVLFGQTGGSGRWASVISTDGGRTWKNWPTSVQIGVDGGQCVLPDGTALAFGFHTKPVKDRAHRYEGQMWASTDNWKTADGPSLIYVDMPHVVEGHGDGGPTERLLGPMFHGRVRVLKDGILLAPYYTKFDADTKVKTSSPYRFRCTLAKSTDHGKTWKYVSSIASLEDITDPEFLKTWQDGFDEPSLAVLPDGKLICAMRVGTYAGQKAVESYSDLAQTVVRDGKYYVSTGEPTRPIYLATSTDGGKTWGKLGPVPGARGACPRLLVLDSGVVALSYGRLYRPSQGNGVVFSADGGETWTAATNIFGGLSGGYTDMAAIGPDRLLYVFDSVTAWGPKYAPDWIGAVDIEVTVP